MADPNWLQQYTNSIGGNSNDLSKSQSNSPTSQDPNWLHQYTNPIGGPPQAKPETPPESRGSTGDYLKSLGAGAVRGIAAGVDYLTAPTIQDINPNAQTFSDVANKYLPEPSKKEGPSITEKAAEGATTGTLLGGPMGGIAGGVAGAVQGWRDAESPNTPGWNALWSTIAGFLAPTAGNIFAKAGRLGLEGANIVNPSELVQAWQDQGITGRTAAGVGENSMPNAVRVYRESPFGDQAINRAEERGNQELQAAANRQADTLGTAVTGQEAGEQAQQEMQTRVQNIKNLIQAGNNALDVNVNPGTTMVQMAPTVVRLINQIAPTSGAEQQVSGLVPRGLRYLENLMNDIVERNNRIPGNNDQLPLAAVKEVKRDVGDLLEQSLMNGDTSKRQLRQIYGALADAERSAYIGTPYERQFHDLQAMSARYYSDLEQYVEPFLKEGYTPERIYKTLLTGSKQGDTKLEGLFNIVPEARGPIASAALRNLGLGSNGEFDAARFFNNWQKVSPEARTTLFGDTHGTLPRAYDQLSLLARRQGESERARNFSGTGGVNEGFTMARRWFNSLAGLVSGAAGAGASMLSGLSPEMGMAGTAGATLGGAYLGGTLAETAANMWVPRLLTNAAFVRWLATPQPLNQLPITLRALAAANPAISTELAAFSNYITGQQKASDTTPQQQNIQLQQREHGRGFQGGGYSGWPEQTPTGYALGGNIDSNKNIQNPRDGSGVWNMSEGYNQGGFINEQKEATKFMGGGAATEPFGVDTNDQAIPYTKGGPALLDHIFKSRVLHKDQWDKTKKVTHTPDNFTSGGQVNNKRKMRSPKIANSTEEKKFAQGGDVEYSSDIDSVIDATKRTKDRIEIEGPRGQKPWHIYNNDTERYSPGEYTKKLAQGGIAHNEDDERSFYNPQLPNVVGGGWAKGGLVKTAKSLLDRAIGMWGGGGVSDSLHATSGTEIGGFYQGGTTYIPHTKEFSTGGMNNPGNIRPKGSSTGFMDYGSIEEGLNAIKNNLLAYQDTHHLNTISEIITRWSPPKENPTAKLIINAAKRTGFEPNQPLNLHDPETMTKMVHAIILQEGKIKDLGNWAANYQNSNKDQANYQNSNKDQKVQNSQEITEEEPERDIAQEPLEPSMPTQASDNSAIASLLGSHAGEEQRSLINLILGVST